METNTSSDVWVKTQDSDEFAAHRKKFRSFAYPFAIGFLVWYFTFIVLMTFARDFVNIQVFGNINIGFLLAISQFITTFGIAWLYDRFATKNLDGPAQKLKAQIESELQN